MRPRSDAELVGMGVVLGLALLVFCLSEATRAAVAAEPTSAAATPQVSRFPTPAAPATPLSDPGQVVPHGEFPISPLPSPPLITSPLPSSATALAGMDLLFPVPAAAASRVPDSFEDRRGDRMHHAMDILAPRHSDVVAVADGTIARLMTSVAGGIAVYQFSADHRYSFFYAHLQGYANGLVEGQKVSRGQVLGYVGTSGNAPPNTPHLHFAIALVERANQWSGGTPVNPSPLWR